MVYLRVRVQKVFSFGCAINNKRTSCESTNYATIQHSLSLSSHQVSMKCVTDSVSECISMSLPL